MTKMLTPKKKFTKSEKQKQACHLLNNHLHTMLYGGSRSGKTTIIVRNIILRALKVSSRHLVVRHRFNHAKTSLWYDTFPKVLALCFPNLRVKWNKSDWYIELPVPEENGGGVSQIWLGGIDDKERVEKILGNEYSTIYANECSQVSYDAITTLRTRLAENTGLKLKFYYDCNPPGKKHWTYVEFVLRLMPGTKDPSELDSVHMVLNPKDNLANLPPEYIGELMKLPKRQRERFLEGLFLSDIEGALWTDYMISCAKAKVPGDAIKTIVALDPSVSSNENSDECGIVVCSIDEFHEGIVEDDLSGKLSTKKWAQRAVNAYHKYEAAYIVAEVNQGGDLVKDAIKAIDPNIKIKTVHASKGKFARAEPITVFYEQDDDMDIRVHHRKPMPDLESEMTEWVPMDTKESPNRIDALVWGLTDLLLPQSKEREVRALVVGGGN